ncbi:hypothetical protein V8C42DRAFT_363154 [Trichoderma barbatum]
MVVSIASRTAYTSNQNTETTTWGIFFASGSRYNKNGTLSGRALFLEGLSGEIEALEETLATIRDNNIIEDRGLKTVYIKCASAYLKMKLTDEWVPVELGFPPREPPQLARIRTTMQEMVNSRHGGMSFKFWFVPGTHFRPKVLELASLPEDEEQ